MAEEKEKKEEAAPASAPAAGGASMLLKVGLGVSILFGIAGFATAGVVMAKKKAADAEAAAVEEVASDAAEGHGEDAATEVSAEDELEEGEQVIGAIFPLDTFVINLNGGKYLRAQIRLEFEGRDVPKRFYPRIVPVRDELLGILSSKRAEDLLTSQGKDNLKKEIKDSINELLRKEDVKNVYFTQFVVQ